MELLVTLSDGTEFKITIENYDPIKLVTELNDSSKTYIVLGNYIVQRYSVAKISPYVEPTTA